MAIYSHRRGVAGLVQGAPGYNSPSVATNPPSTPTTEPTYNPAVHTSVWFDDFESGTSGNAPTNYALNQSGGSIIIDGTTAFSGTQSCKFTVNSGCLAAGNDRNVGLEKTVGTLSAYSSAQRNWYVSLNAKYDSGYYDLNCGGEFKELYVFRAAGGDPTGSCAFLATKNGGPTACPDFYGSSVVPSGQIGWSLVCHSETGSAQPASCSGVKESLRQYLNTTSARPQDIDDGNWHRITYKFRRETAPDAGDGGAWIWVDGNQAMAYDGGDASNNSTHNKVYTRSAEFYVVQIFGIVNQGLSSAGNRWLDNLRIYRDST